MHLPASNRPHPFPSPDDAEEPSESRSTRSPAMMLPPWGRPARPPRSNTPGKAVGAVTRSPGCSSPRSAEEGSTPSSGLPNRPHGTRRSSTRFAGTRGPASVKPYVVQTRRVPGPSARTAAFDTLSPPTVTSDNDRLGTAPRPPSATTCVVSVPYFRCRSERHHPANHEHRTVAHHEISTCPGSMHKQHPRRRQMRSGRIATTNTDNRHPDFPRRTDASTHCAGEGRHRAQPTSAIPCFPPSRERQHRRPARASS